MLFYANGVAPGSLGLPPSGGYPRDPVNTF